jgi:tRNA threonylcarbamoyladenosine biosynthesis protein TsaE
LDRIISHELKETDALGKWIAERIDQNSIICLTGDLGAGKTTLAQAIMRHLGVGEAITSPTYTIVNEYHEPLTIFHFDVYRISNSDEMYEIGFDDYLNQEAVIIIEWANLIKDLIPEEAIWIELKYTDEMDVREISIQGLEDTYEDIGN